MHISGKTLCDVIRGPVGPLLSVHAAAFIRGRSINFHQRRTEISGGEMGKNEERGRSRAGKRLNGTQYIIVVAL